MNDGTPPTAWTPDGETPMGEASKLPNEDTEQVLEHLRTQGWHLQLPPKETLATANHPAYKHSTRDDRDE